ncbi:transmembrane protein 5-like [Elysia marginata]|uniref:Transmembrane protein 5-like n=1 Tax=Elysia marginata TaxID=1093978 RepID=A0AAV4IK01_9GAST|nr:transmembrane protein 5-like [Elysia marginata]
MSHRCWQWQGLSFRKVAYCVLSFYLLVAVYYGIHHLQLTLESSKEAKDAASKPISIADVVDDPAWNPWGEKFESEVQLTRHHEPPEMWKQLEQQEQEVEQPQLREYRAVQSEDNQRLRREQDRKVRDLGTRKPISLSSHSSREVFKIVEVWGKAAIGLYLWQHIFDADLEDRLNGVWRYGEKTVGTIKFRFRTGPGVVPSKVPRETEHLLMIINGREPSKIGAGKVWLDSLPAFPLLKNVIVVLLGNERCNNSWFHPYLVTNGGPVKALFVVYDSPDIDNINVFQWPLGVATYRDFPVVQNSDLYTGKDRRYMFNFLGTIYPNSSRETLLTAVRNSPYSDRGYMRARAEWQPEESPESREQYLYALSNSDLTLNPVGINTECYRIYEAMAMGSIPVIENIMTPGHCGGSSLSQQKSLQNSLLAAKEGSQKLKALLNSQNIPSNPILISKEKFLSSESAPLRLLKEFDAPVIYVRNWDRDLQDVLRKEAAMSSEDKAARRRGMLRWYSSFLANMRHRLVSVLEDKFFPHHPSV